MSDKGSVGINIRDLQKITKKIHKLTGRTRSYHADQLARFAVEMILTRAKLKAPVDLGRLRDSDAVNKLGAGKYQFGFTSEYAYVQDSGFKEKRIEAKSAKALYIPITRLGRRQGPLKGRTLRLRRAGRRPARGAARPGRDYVFRKSVKSPRVKRYGSQRGPNKYFSGTIERMTRNKQRFLERLSKAFVAQLKAQGELK